MSHGVKFRIAPDGPLLQMSWPDQQYRNGWLALDRNANGMIDDFTELFGNMAPQPSSDDPNGYHALAVFDDPMNGGNGNGVIDPGDSVYAQLRLWIDANHNGISEPDELYTLPEMGIFRIDLNTSCQNTLMQTEIRFATARVSGMKQAMATMFAMTYFSVFNQFSRGAINIVRNAFLIFLFSGIAAAQTCPVLSAGKTAAIVNYVRKEYKLNDSVELKLLKEEPFGNTCDQTLTFEGKTRVKAWQVTLYLSPDERFLTSELFDTTVDPQEAARRKAEALMAGLSENRGSSKGSDTAPVTIVEFSDFECPYCKKFTDILAQVLPEEKDEVRVVFHHMPLSVHPWARLAAEGAACAQLQSADAFWSIHDQLFQHQQEIAAENIKQKLSEYAQNTKSLDTKSFQACLDNEMSLGLVFRDMNLAAANNLRRLPRSL